MWCCVGFHKWSKWKEIASGKVGHITPRGVSGPTLIIGSFLTQKRICENCGKQQLEKLSTKYE